MKGLDDYGDMRLHEALQWLRATVADTGEAPEAHRNALFLALLLETLTRINALPESLCEFRSRASLEMAPAM